HPGGVLWTLADDAPDLDRQEQASSAGSPVGHRAAAIVRCGVGRLVAGLVPGRRVSRGYGDQTCADELRPVYEPEMATDVVARARAVQQRPRVQACGRHPEQDRERFDQV